MALDFSHKTLREEVAIYLRKRILSGDIKPGEKINEVEISKELKISRGPVREALRQIEQEGLVLYSPNKGCTVNVLKPANISEVYLIRCTLEVLAVKVYSGMMRAESIVQMESAARRMGAAAKLKDLSGIVEYDQKLHSIIVTEAGLDRLYKAWSSFDGDNAAAYYTMRKSDLMPFEYLERNHMLIVDAFKEGNQSEIQHVIENHYMVVPKDLYRYNNLEPDSLTSVYSNR